MLNSSSTTKMQQLGLFCLFLPVYKLQSSGKSECNKRQSFSSYECQVVWIAEVYTEVFKDSHLLESNFLNLMPIRQVKYYSRLFQGQESLHPIV